MRRRLYISHHAEVCGFNETETFDLQSTRGVFATRGFFEDCKHETGWESLIGPLVVDQGHI